MINDASITVIIPVLNEERSLPRVLADIPAWVDRVIVVDNGSTDDTAQVAKRHGATVVRESVRGYGAACLRGIAVAADADILVFLDGDYSDFPEQMDRLVEPIAAGRADMVIGSRTLGRRERGVLTAVQRFGNALSCFLIRRLWNHRYSDLGPFRAIRRNALDVLGVNDRTYGWTIQMQIRAIRSGLRICETPVDYRRRIGQSNISGTLRGIVGAGTKILTMVVMERFSRVTVQRYAVRPRHLIVFTRYPEPGRAKTRLIPALGAARASELHGEMTAHTLHTIGQLCFTQNVSTEVRFTGAQIEKMVDCVGGGFTCLPQGEGDLGARMHRAMCDALARGAERVMVIGTDCPSLDAATLNEAFKRLSDRDFVVGPSDDGGYYLIGMRCPCKSLFQGIEWGTTSVLDETLYRAAGESLTKYRLATRSDVDLPENIAEWNRNQRPRVTLIIPTLNEAECLPSAIASAREADRIELIVVDGGSDDDTAGIAEANGARVIRSAPGRAQQMNAGAAQARGETLLFLHADTRLPPNYVEEIDRIFGYWFTLINCDPHG